MGIHNSLTEFYLGLYCSLFGDLTDRFTGYIDCAGFDRDFQEIRDRCRHEGISFMTKCLPEYGKALDKCLSTGQPLSIPHFQKKKGTNIPLFMGSLMEQVVNTDGVADDYPVISIEAVRSMRQVAFLLYKLKLPFTDEQQNDVLDQFVSTDCSLPAAYAAGRESTEGQLILRLARDITSRAFCSFDPYDITPRHGPGAVATGERNWDKMRFKRYYSKIEEVYPYSEYFFYNINHLCDELPTLEAFETLENGVAKVILVPKDSRGPRLISCEPLEYQWMQQGLGGAMVKHLEKHDLTRGHVNFTSQEVNRQLALAGSVDGQYVTLDMKEASDRVAKELVVDLFDGVPRLQRALMALRTDATTMPDGKIVSLNKYAPMGSALCFPVEAYVFWALATAIIRRHKSLPLKEAAARVWVYGDDIILHREDYACVMQHFPLFGLMFNERKCCTWGLYRESCGMDAYKGTNVTPLKMRQVWSSNRTEILPSYTAYYGWLVQNGYHRSAAYIRKKVEARFERLPIATSPDVDYLHWLEPYGDAWRYNRKHFKHRVNRDLQRFEINVLRTCARYKVTRAHDWSTLLEIHSRQPDDYGREGELPGTYAVPHRSYLKRGWSACESMHFSG